MEYLKIAQDLDMYGVEIFDIADDKQVHWKLGVAPSGLHFFKSGANNKVDDEIVENNKKSKFPKFLHWSDVRNISFKDKKFVIKTIRKEDETGGVGKDLSYPFFSDNLNTNKLILDLCVGNHNLFLRRRQPDSLEVQQMKSQASEDKARKQEEKFRWEREHLLRLETERDRNHLAILNNELKEQLAALQEALRRSEDVNALLAEKAHISETEGLMLVQRATHSENEKQQLRMSAIKIEEEKFMFENRAKDTSRLNEDLIRDNEKLKKENYKLRADLTLSREAERDAKSRLHGLTMANAYTPMNTLPPFYDAAIGIDQPMLYPTDIDPSAYFGDGGSFYTFGDEINTTNIQELSNQVEKERSERQQMSDKVKSQLNAMRDEINCLKLNDPTNFHLSQPSNEEQYSTARQSQPPSGITSRNAFLNDL